MKSSENGSIGLAVVLAVAAIFCALMYSRNSAMNIGNSVKEAERGMNAELARINNISDLSIARSLLNSAKFGSGYEPSIYPDNYFADNWNLKANSAGAGVSASQNNFTLRSFSSVATKDSNNVAQSLFGSDASKKQLDQMNSGKNLKLIRLNRDPFHYYYVRSVDVSVKNKMLLAKGGSKTLDVESVGRISLPPPEPSAARLEISLASPTNWSTNFGTQANPLPAGNYKLRLLASGIVYYGELSRSNGAKIIMGLKDNEIIHAANNVKAKNIILGITEDIQMGENKTTVEQVNETKEVEAQASGTVVMNASSCSFSMSGGSSGSGGGSGSGQSGGASTSSSTNSTSSTILEPMEIEAKIFRVDGTEADVGFKKTIYIASTVTTTTVTNTTNVASNQSGDGGPQCRNRCGADRDSLGNDAFLDNLIQSSSASNPAAYDLYRPTQSSQLPAPGGTVCSSLGLYGQYVAQQLGLSKLGDLKNGGNWGLYGQVVNSPEARYKEQLVAYVPPACVRQLIGTRTACGCFAEDTLIRMGDGSEMKASEIRQGDLVWNPRAKRVQHVKRVIAGPEKIPLYSVRVAAKVVKVTSEHPFLTDKGMRAANQLAAGDVIIDEGKDSPVESVTQEILKDGEEAPVVWNFELEGSDNDDDHFVLANGVMTGDLYLQIKLKKQSLLMP